MTSQLRPDARTKTSISPTEVLKIYCEQMLRMVQSLDIEMATSDHHAKAKILCQLYFGNTIIP